MQEIENLFRPTSASVRQMLADQVGGFEIPPYQRPYRWQPADIRRLIEDVMASMNRIPKDPNAVTFVGAIITLSGVSGDHKVNVKEARRVIDGQQRLSTLSVMSVALREQLLRYPFQQYLDSKDSAEEMESDEAKLVASLHEMALELAGNLESCIVEEFKVGEGAYRYVPKIVREMADTWGKKPSEARYLSPVANLLFSYARSWETPNERFSPAMPSQKEFPEAVGASVEDHQLLLRRYKDVRTSLSEMSKANDKNLGEIVEVETLLGDDGVIAKLFPKIDNRIVLFRSVESESFPAFEVARSVAFAECLLSRIAVTNIHASEESYAFDLFDSLNSTGEPLTAFETFLPHVVKAETESGNSWAETQSFLDMSMISHYLAETKSAVQQETSRFLISFLLADHGTKAGSHHNDQRYELQRLYNGSGSNLSPTTLDEKRAFTRSMRDCAATHFELWANGRLGTEASNNRRHVDEEAMLCLKFLSSTNHRVTVAPMSRWVSNYWSEPSDEARDAVCSVIKSMTAFSVMWRASHGGIDGIDAKYRSLMLDGHPETGLPPLCRVEGSGNLPDPADLAEALLSICADADTSVAFSDKDSWVERVLTRPVYDDNEAVTRFLLLLAAHHAVPGRKGLAKDGAIADHTNMLTGERWDQSTLKTIEHVAPQSPSADENSWDAALYQQSGTIHQIGNLALLPLDDNAWLSNRSWSDKRAIYKVLSATDPEAAASELKAAEENGLSLTDERREQIVERRRHLPALASVPHSGDWDAKHIRARSKNTLGRAGDILFGWLS